MIQIHYLYVLLPKDGVHGNLSKKIFLRTFAEDDHECCHHAGKPQQVLVRRESNPARAKPRITVKGEQVHYVEHQQGHQHSTSKSANQFVIPQASDDDNEIILEQVQDKRGNVIYYGDGQASSQPPINTAPDGNYDGSLITTGGYRVETLEEIKAKVSQEFTTQDDDEYSDDDRLVIDQLAEEDTPQSEATSTKYRFPSGPYIETDSEATPTKPKHIPVDTSDDESMPDLEDAAEEMPLLEPLPELDDIGALETQSTIQSEIRKRKSLPAGSGSLSPVKRQRRGIRRSQSTTEARQNPKSSASNRLTSLIEKTREICENPTSQPSQKKRKVLTKRSPKKRQRSESASSSEDEAHPEVFHPSSSHSRQGHNPTKMHAKAKHQRIRSDPELPRNSTTPVLRPEPCANESRIDSDRGGSSSDGIPDLSQTAMRKRRRILDQLKDTPEFENARLSGGGRARRTAAGRPARSAARTASEKTKQNLNDEKGRLKPIVVEKTEKVKQEKKEVKSEFAEPKPKPGPTRRQRRPSKKTRRKSDHYVDNHGWEPVGVCENRCILKPGENTYIDRVSFDTVRNVNTDRVVNRLDSVAIYAGEDEPPMYAIIVDLYRETSGQIMAWVYWYYKREDAEAPSSTYVAGEQELLASRHHDSISIASLLRSFHTLTYYEYRRWRAQGAHEGANNYSSSDENHVTVKKEEDIPSLNGESASWERKPSDREPRTNFNFIKPGDEVFFVRRFYDHSTRSIVITPSFLKDKSESSTVTRPRSRRLRRPANTEMLHPTS
ncbi:Oidioi.mRNA.OKI2018_I69.chr1.g1847.t1.cds [Oikopleura dioica]|uniref:Oidioi.mRNA.OKI2018_I69.chr1.g1847.t1.cds n=1 Tax=Oikopleura dioica TaxID=34765 RepID=A0ABN7SU81_OIKDI|nr:Oidioi.mRNA.OKI2018_I69.chr1.g1847.t1.cds [Oikopleura dioica]